MARTIRENGYDIQEFGRIISGFISDKDHEHRELDEELATLTAATG